MGSDKTVNMAKRLSGIVLVLALFTGCAQQAQTRIVELDPYVGPRPIQMEPLRPPVVQRPPEVLPDRPATADGGWIPPRGISNRWQCIVIHHSASDKSTPQSMADYHVKTRGWDALGYHFVIGNGVGYGDGRVFVGERWSRQMHGAHCKTPGNHFNEHGIGICLIGDLDDHAPSRAQVESLARLIAFLQVQCGIPKNKIHTHGGVTGKTACPGRNFSLSAVLKKVSAAETMSASSK